MHLIRLNGSAKFVALITRRFMPKAQRLTEKMQIIYTSVVQRNLGVRKHSKSEAGLPEHSWRRVSSAKPMPKNSLRSKYNLAKVYQSVISASYEERLRKRA